MMHPLSEGARVQDMRSKYGSIKVCEDIVLGRIAAILMIISFCAPETA